MLSYTAASTSLTGITAGAAQAGVGGILYTNSVGSSGYGNASNITTLTYPYTTSTHINPSTGFYSIDEGLYPFTGKVVSEQDKSFVLGFKTRHPDFDTYSSEITLILARKPGLTNTVLFMPLIYDLAKELRATIDKIFNDDVVEKIVDGQTP
jgi:hypothetical protein